MKRPALILALSITLSVITVVSDYHAAFFVIWLAFILTLYFLKRTNGFLLIAAVLLALACGANAYLRLNNEITVSGKAEITAQLNDYSIDEYGTLKASFNILSINDAPNAEKTAALIKIYDYAKLYDKKPEYGGIYHISDVTINENIVTNPGGYDYGFYLKTIGKKLSATAKAEDLKLIRTEHLPFGMDIIRNFKRSIEEVFKENLTESNYALISGVLFGSNDSDKYAEPYRSTGTAHILAVSGLHVGIVYYLALKLSEILRLKKYKEYLCLLLVFLYVAMSGFSISAMRAFTMIAILTLTKKCSRSYDPFNSLLLAFDLFVMINPLCMFTISFQMSFSACFGLCVLYPPLNKRIDGCKSKTLRKIASAFCISLCAQLPVSLVSAAYFGTINPYSLAANMLIVPFTALLIAFSVFCLLVCPISPISVYAFRVLALICNYFDFVTNTFSSMPLSVIKVERPSAPAVICGFVLLLILFGYFDLRKTKHRHAALCVAAMLAVCFSSANLRLRENNRVCFLDVGFGDCCVIMTTDGANYMIDCGEGFGTRTAQYDIVPFLEHYNIKKLDAVFITHTDIDHCGAFEYLLGMVDIGRVYINNDATRKYKQLYSLAEEAAIPVFSMRKGDMINEGKLLFNVLWPEENAPVIEGGNSASAVIYLSIDSTQFLFCADMDASAAQYIAETYVLSPVDIIKMPHHGSYYKALENFTAACSPECCIISVGKNSYSLPNEPTLAYLSANDIKTYSTMENGCIEITLSKDGYTVEGYADKQRRK